MFMWRNRVSGSEDGGCVGEPGVNHRRHGQTSPLVKRRVVFGKGQAWRTRSSEGGARSGWSLALRMRVPSLQ